MASPRPPKLQRVQGVTKQKDRRESTRDWVSLPVVLELADGRSRLVHAKDLSRCGVSVSTPCRLPIGMKLKARIEFPSVVPPLDCDVEVVRVNDKGTEAGLRFIGVDREGQLGIVLWLLESRRSEPREHVSRPPIWLVNRSASRRKRGSDRVIAEPGDEFPFHRSAAS